jgi:putative cardiolipin synthase
MKHASRRIRQRSAAALLLASVLALAGCAGFQPARPAPETALPDAQSTLWTEIAAVRQDNWHRVLNGGEDALDWRLRLIDSASSSIDLETFLWKPDASGARVLQRLLAAADRGVRVRILLDDSFTMHEDLALHAIDRHANVEYRIYNPFARRHDNVVLRQLLNLGEFGRVNRRLHNKTLIVDGRAAITGGRNIADEYFGLDPVFNFRDMELLFAGEPVAEATRHFDRFWNSRWAVPLDEFIAAPRDGRDMDAMRTWLAGTDGAPPEPPAVRRAAWLAAARQGIGGEARFVADAPAPDEGSPGCSRSNCWR